MLAFFLVFWIGQSVAGFLHHNDEQRQHGGQQLTYGQFLVSGEFLETTFENWESEFLQMAAFVFMAAFLAQKGSAESKKPEGDPELDADPEKKKTADSPGPVLRGGLALKVYNHSLSLALAGLFLFSFVMHAVGGAKTYNEEATQHGEPTLSLGAFMLSSTFWYQSLQNWQSEFLAVATLVLLSIFLRQKGSPESKPVHAAHSQTGK
jgi:hypothetical protein